MDFSTVVATSTLLNGVTSLLKNARDLAKDVSDTDLKEKIGDAYDGLLSLRERLLTLDDEIRSLRAQLEDKHAYVGPFPPFGYYYATNDEAKEYPLCPKCYQLQPSKKSFLSFEHRSGANKRSCNFCDYSLFEKPENLHSNSRRMVSRGHDPYTY